MEQRMEVGEPAQAEPPVKPASAKYRLNRRAAYLFGGAFAVLGIATTFVCFVRMEPQRRLGYLRESAQAFVEHGEWKQAAVQLFNIVQINPQDAQAWYQLGAVQLQAARQEDVKANARRERLRSAVHCYRRAVEIDPSHWRARRWLLELDLRGGNWTEARRHAAVLARQAPESPLIEAAAELLPTAHFAELRNARRVVHSDEDASDALALLESLHRVDPVDLEVLRLLSLARTRLGLGAARDADLKLAEKGSIGTACTACIRAECAVAEGDLDAAERIARGATGSLPVEATARRILAEIAEQRALRDPASAVVYWDRAAEQYRAMLKLNPNDVAAGNNLAWLLGSKLGRVSEGAAIAAEFLEKTDSPPAALLDTYGALLLQTNRAAEAVPVLERAAVAYHDPQVLFHLAKAYCQAQRPEDGIGILRDLVARTDGSPAEARRLLTQIERNYSH
jgi:tetratricopeptide (TPR) repeat protein